MNLGYVLERERGYTQKERDIISGIFKTALTSTIKLFYDTEFPIREVSPQKKEPYQRIAVFALNLPEPQKPIRAILASMDIGAYVELINEDLLKANEDYGLMVGQKLIKELCGRFACCRGVAAVKDYKTLAEKQKEIDDILESYGLA